MKKTSGQSLVEFAIILPIFLFFVMILIDLGRIVYFYNVLHNSVREGARYGVIYPNDAAQIQSIVKSSAVGLDQSRIQVVVLALPVADPKTVQVDVEYEFPPVTPLVKAIIGTDIILKSSTTMNVEG